MPPHPNPDNLIPPGERRELRSVVRQQFKVLRAEVKQRELELVGEMERRLVERYRNADKAIDDLNWQIREVVDAAQRQVDDLVRAAGDVVETGMGFGPISLYTPQVRGRSEDRSQLHRAMSAAIKEQVTQATLALERKEADLLRLLALESLETDAARGFLARIPTVAELVPAARLREVEAAFDEELT
jgi:hypothetical protein